MLSAAKPGSTVRLEIPDFASLNSGYMLFLGHAHNAQPGNVAARVDLDQCERAPNG
jgi:hypothetical protein